MHTKNYAIALPAAAGLAAVMLLTACGGGTSTSSHPSTGTTTSPAAAQAASTVAVTDQEDSNWAGYVVASSATAKTSFSAVSGSWTQPTVDCAAGSPSDSAFWIGLGGYTADHLEQTGTSADCSASGQASYSAWYELVPAAQVPVTMTVRPGDRLRIPRCLRQPRHPGHTPAAAPASTSHALPGVPRPAPAAACG